MPHDMTVFFPDVSNNQWGSEELTDDGQKKLRDFLYATSGIAGIAHKMSEGAAFIDPYGSLCQNICAQRRTSFIGYHFATADPAAAQVANWQAARGGANVMIDFEQLDSNGYPLLNMGQFWNLVDAFNAVNVNVALAYIPQWYADDISANLSPLAPSGIALVSSAYPLGYSVGPPSDVYRGCDGDSGEGWDAYCGGPVPAIWQFTSTAKIGDLTVDCNAFQGTSTELDQLFTGAT